MGTIMVNYSEHFTHDIFYSQFFITMKLLRFIVFLKWNRKNIFQVFIALVSALFIYRLWTEPTIDSKAEKLIISQMIIIANIIFEIQKSVSI